MAYDLVVTTWTRGMGGVEASAVTRKAEYLTLDAALVDGQELLRRRDGKALRVTVDVDDGECLTPVNAPEAEEEV